jgi:hypothetical protein
LIAKATPENLFSRQCDASFVSRVERGRGRTLIKTGKKVGLIEQKPALAAPFPRSALLL